jgi:lipoprotein NlpD
MKPGVLHAVTGLPVLLALALAGCGTAPVAAPVTERSVNAAPVSERSVNRAPAAPPRTAPAAATATPAEPAKPAPAPAPEPVAAAGPAEPTAPPTQAEPVKPAEPAPVVKPAPAPEAIVVQRIEEPPPPPYREGDWRPEFHVVKKGETLYSIALDYGQEYRDLAAWNNLTDPGVIKVDQRLRLFPPKGSETAAAPVEEAPAATAVRVKSEPKGQKLPYSEQALAQLQGRAATPVASLPPASIAPPKPAPRPAATKAREVADGKLTWEWPANGKLGYAFGQGSNQKGIAIDGKMGEAVMASAPGKVVYSGSGLRGYGKLVIIKHNASYLSVYAHNSQILVKEGQSVAKGQKIAEMGNTDSSRVGLHFEIRRLGKPVDPMLYLPGRAS